MVPIHPDYGENSQDLSSGSKGRRTRILTALGQGALLALQRRLAEAEASAAELTERFKAAEIVESENTQLAIRSRQHQAAPSGRPSKAP